MRMTLQNNGDSFSDFAGFNLTAVKVEIPMPEEEEVVHFDASGFLIFNSDAST